jgi:hypothetical protein
VAISPKNSSSNAYVEEEFPLIFEGGIRTTPCSDITLVDFELSLGRKTGFVCPENVT